MTTHEIPRPLLNDIVEALDAYEEDTLATRLRALLPERDVWLPSQHLVEAAAGALLRTVPETAHWPAVIPRVSGWLIALHDAGVQFIINGEEE